MFIDQRLIQKDGLFGASLIAGTSLQKVYNHQELEIVDVQNICNKLCLAIISQQTQQQNTNADELEAKAIIPYRVITSLFYGTIKIHHQQVNNLLKLSKNLMLRSRSVIKSIAVPISNICKRKTIEFPKACAAKKRRLTKFIPVPEIPNYTELLNESAELAKFPLFEEYDASNLPTLSHTNIRNFTIREIKSEFTLPELDDDNDDFGNATSAELAEFLDFLSDNNKQNINKLEKSKRKSSTTESILLNKIAKISYEGVNECTNNLVHCEEKQNEVVSMSQLACDNNNNYVLISPSQSSNQSIGAAPSAAPIDFTPNSANLVLQQKSTSKASKLIVDKVIRKSEAEMCAQLKNNNSTKRRSTIIQPKKLRRVTSTELFNRLNRNHLIKVSFKNKRQISAESIQQNYINILRDIVRYFVDDNLATEIYPNWNKTNNIRRNCKIQLQDNFSKLPLIDSELETINNNQNDSGVNDDTLLMESALNHKQDDLNSINIDCSHMEYYQPYGTMVKLLNISHSSKVDEIYVKSFFRNITNRQDAAKTFSSLLSLSKNGFIKIIHKENTNEMHYIKLGHVSEQLINEVLLKWSA